MDDHLADLPADIEDAALAAALTRRAAQLAARMRADGLVGQAKTSISDVVTAADHAAEELVEGALRRLRPDDGILGEEGAEAESRSGRTWVVDPVDGTYNFLAGLGTWCSALALRDTDGLVLGAVHQPAVDEAWLGGRDLPTSLNGTAVGALADLPLAEVAMATYLHPAVLHVDDLREPWLAAIAGAATVRMFGSGSCDLAAVAAGRIGVWAQQSVPEWDWLPGAALVTAAGGRAEQVEVRGHVWSVAGRPTAVEQVLAALRSRV
ncbi:inositol monophosphatase family protein [Janibacter terrae]|uniref:Inositol monophosphatase family protein n=1 Tax=Janibacter terrae TaxID=103817 RepID=A0ABZ2FDT2_9MICO|nr:inositol monophosphatase [Janibacter terrae]